MKIRKARSGEEALFLTEEFDLAVVLLDVQMKGMDGFETAKFIRSRRKTQHTPIIFLTAYNDNRLSVEDAYALGAVDYIVKPVPPVILRAKVAGFVDFFRKTREIEQFAAFKRASDALQEELREADKRKDAFLAMLGHELRNPLAPIANALQILRLTKNKDQLIEAAVETMERQVRQMIRLVDDLLDINRISRGKISLRRERTDLAPIIHHAVESTKAIYKDKDHELTIELPPERLNVEADSARLTQVMANLLNNACKFTEAGGKISVNAEQNGDECVIRVRDNGVGIAAADFERIFEMFVQLENSPEGHKSGLGIGLALVKNLVSMHDGTIDVISAGPGQGCEFIIRMPMATPGV
jgi:signal transduction histidine kinase